MTTAIYAGRALSKFLRIRSSFALCLACGLVCAFPAIILAGDASSEFRIVDEPIELSVFFPNWHDIPYDDDSPVEQHAAELTGISLASIDSEAGKPAREIADLLVRSANMPDIVGGSGLRRIFNKYGPQGAFVKLDPLIERYAPNLRAFFNDNPELYRAATSYDGHLYYVPFFPDGQITTGYFVRQEWLEKLALDTPDTVDAFYAMLKAFKSMDPNGNGKQDEIPFFTPNFEYLLQLSSLWGARSSGRSGSLDFYLDGNELVHGLAQPRYREVIHNLAQWYDEGLIAFDLLEREGIKEEAIHEKNIVGATLSWFDKVASFNDLLEASIPGFALLPVLPPMTASGERATLRSRDRITAHGWAISFSNEHPIETMKYFDFWFSDKGRWLNNYGLEGVHYDLIDGRPVIVPEILNGTVSARNLLRDAGALAPRGVRIDYAFEWQWINEIGREGIQRYIDNNVLFESTLPSSLNAREQRVVDLYWNDVKSHMLAQSEAWIRGDGDVDEEWEEYLYKLDTLGYSKVTEAVNAARWRNLYGE